MFTNIFLFTKCINIISMRDGLRVRLCQRRLMIKYNTVELPIDESTSRMLHKYNKISTITSNNNNIVDRSVLTCKRLWKGGAHH